MLISVIVAVYNIEPYIARCIESIQKQSHSELEIILVDDGSTDRSGIICDEYASKDSRIHVIHRKNGGLSAARNTGITIATGEYIAFVDGDDWIDTDMYENMAGLANEYDADLVACRYRCIYKNNIVDASSGIVKLYHKPYEMLIDYLKEEEEILIQHAAWNKLYKRSLLQNERFPEGKWYEDVVFSAKILSGIVRGVYVDSAFYNYVCQREDSIMSAGLTERIFTDLIPAYLEKETFLKDLDIILPLRIHQFYLYKRLLNLYLELGEGPNRKFRHHRRMIRHILKERKETISEVYEIDIAKRTEKIKLQIFLASPVLFCIVMFINNRFVLPVRLKRKREKK